MKESMSPKLVVNCCWHSIILKFCYMLADNSKLFYVISLLVTYLYFCIFRIHLQEISPFERNHSAVVTVVYAKQDEGVQPWVNPHHESFDCFQENKGDWNVAFMFYHVYHIYECAFYKKAGQHGYKRLVYYPFLLRAKETKKKRACLLKGEIDQAIWLLCKELKKRRMAAIACWIDTHRVNHRNSYSRPYREIGG